MVINPFFDWGNDRPPRTPWHETVDLRGPRQGGHQAPPRRRARELRGTYAGLAHPAVIEHLQRLGVTAVELLPVHQFVHDSHLVDRGLRNYWGYNSIGFLAPHNDYASRGQRGEQVQEFKQMVQALHEAGIEVILDVVYNHTAEGNHLGPMLSFKGIDNAAYYRLADDQRYYMDYTGTGNSLNMRHPHVLQLIMDSLRYWVTEMHVDGFRFDLASTLARELHDVDRLSAFFDLIQQDPVVSQVKLIAEPWDVGEGGYQVGNFPPLWSEWNGKYRDTVRDFWRGEDQTLGEFAYRFTGSSDLYETRRPPALRQHQLRHRPRRLHAARPRLLQREAQRGQRRGQPRRRDRTTGRGTAASEGDTDDPEVRSLRRRQQRNLLTTLFLSPGRPDAARRRRDRPHPARQQQRLLPGQRDLVVRLALREDERRPPGASPPTWPLPPEPPGVPPAALLPGPPDPRRDRDATSAGSRPTARRCRDEDWDAGFAKSLGVFLNGRRHPRPRPPGRADHRRQLPAAVQRPLRGHRLHHPAGRLGRRTGTSSSTPTTCRWRPTRPPARSGTRPSPGSPVSAKVPVKKGEPIQVGARSLVVLRRVD